MAVLVGRKKGHMVCYGQKIKTMKKKKEKHVQDMLLWAAVSISQVRRKKYKRLFIDMKSRKPKDKERKSVYKAKMMMVMVKGT